MTIIQKFLFLGVIMTVTTFSYEGSGVGATKSIPVIDFEKRQSIPQAAAPLIALSAPIASAIERTPIEVPVLPPSSSPLADPVEAIEKIKGGDLGGVISILKERGEEVPEEPKSQFEVEPVLRTPPFVLAESPGTLSQSFYRVGDEPPPVLGAERILVSDLRTGDSFLASKPMLRWPLASVTKLMTAVIVLRDMDLAQVVSIGPNDFLPQSLEKSLQPGDKYSVRDLLRALLSASSNEAGEAIANFYGHANFISAMNNQARDWHLDDTHFDDPTGLSSSNQSTLRDLSKLMLQIYDSYPDILKITRTASWSIKEIDSGKTRIVKSTHLFAGQPYFIGGKTGYTDEAGGNLVSVMKHKERPLLIVVLGSDDRFAETEKLFSWFKNNFSAGR